MRSRSGWERDPEYIVNLAKQLVGQNALKIIIADASLPDTTPRVIQSYVTAVITNKIVKMNDATLGRICAYSSSKGVHHNRTPQTRKPSFINVTGITDILGSDQSHFFSDLGIGEYLEQIAIMVVTCVVYDIVFQDKWQACW